MATAFNGLEPLGIISPAPKSKKRYDPNRRSSHAQKKKKNRIINQISTVDTPPCVLLHVVSWWCPSSKRGRPLWRKTIRKMGGPENTCIENKLYNKQIFNKLLCLHTYPHTGIPNGQLDGRIPGHDAARSQRCARRERWCRPERRAWRSGKSEGAWGHLINGPGFLQILLTSPNFPGPVDVCACVFAL